MKMVKAGYEILSSVNRDEVLKHIEKCGRECYQSSWKIADGTAPEFVKMLHSVGHGSVLEHFGFTVKFINDRGVSHEEVRHRLASFSQESTRYCNYSNDRFDNECTFIDLWRGMCLDPKVSKLSVNVFHEIYEVWLDATEHAEKAYNKMIELGATPQIARAVLPNSLKTSIVITANLREWHLILTQRTSIKAHPQMREVMVPLLKELQQILPEIFGDIVPYEGEEVA